ncbi:N-acyl homoserine lactonase family protein [Sphingomonas sp.]|uniref:N-acyl homoserine lactonase family protein n=1 Tax=Sphingomonas sp. TaxID=28214 RepID=UPI001EC85E41|nr:N-acyl homoserine lactonase family protein [Sphingomonas sp.]MBX3595543.1 N-acyl homoserine lactonase family protein [Sphingomonas sp.]
MGQAAPVPEAPEMRLWRIDCGTLAFSDFGAFSDTRDYDGQRRTLTDSCYLIRHGDAYLLWDSGLSASLIGAPQSDDGETISLDRTIEAQLAQIGVKPAQVVYLGISHYHDDHTGQAAAFPGATLLIGAQEWQAIRTVRPESERERFRPWISRGGKVEPVARDRDVFGDGSVMILAMPGHTPGHRALLVKLPKTGYVLLSGDQFHVRESMAMDLVPTFNFDRADTLASSDRFRRIAKKLNARVVVQHDPRDIAKLPLFPESAR